MNLTEQIAIIDLEGSPCEFGEPRGNWENWRIRFRDKARASLSHLKLPISHPVKLVCRFRIRENARAHDIDNLLKPLIDALGAAGLFPRTRGGGNASEWNTQDDWVYAIEAEKELVSSRASTHVEIYVSPDVAGMVKPG